MHRFNSVLRYVVPVLLVASAALVTFSRQSVALALPSISGSICGFSDTVTNAGLYGGTSYWSGIPGTQIFVNVVAVSGNNAFVIVPLNGPPIVNVTNFTSFSGTYTLSPTLGNVYEIDGGSGGTLTVNISCGSSSASSISYISDDNRLDNNGDQGAQSVAIYCNSDGSLNLIPLQLLNPGPGSTSIKDTKGINIIVKTAPLSTIAANTTVTYPYGISVTAWSDGSWTVYRAELTGTGKTFAARVFPGQCPQVKK